MNSLKIASKRKKSSLAQDLRHYTEQKILQRQNIQRKYSNDQIIIKANIREFIMNYIMKDYY